MCGVIADQGGGKTNYLAQVGYKAVLQGRKVVSNFHLKFPEPYNQLVSYHGFDEVADDPDLVIDSEVLWDELGKGADSYKFMGQRENDLLDLAIYLRKRGARCTYSVQNRSFVTARLRRITEGFIFMEDLDRHIKHKPPYVCNGLFRQVFTDASFRVYGEMVWNGVYTRDLYDSQEMIKVKETKLGKQFKALTPKATNGKTILKNFLEEIDDEE